MLGTLYLKPGHRAWTLICCVRRVCDYILQADGSKLDSHILPGGPCEGARMPAEFKTPSKCSFLLL